MRCRDYDNIYYTRMNLLKIKQKSRLLEKNQNKLTVGKKKDDIINSTRFNMCV